MGSCCCCRLLRYSTSYIAGHIGTAAMVDPSKEKDTMMQSSHSQSIGQIHLSDKRADVRRATRVLHQFA